MIHSWCHLLLIGLTAFTVTGCTRDDMADQPKYKTYGKSHFFADGMMSRPISDGTVTRAGRVNHDEALPWSSAVDDNANFPFAITRADLQRGQQLFTIYCTPCHGQLGDGQGMIVQRGFTPPPTYHQDRLRNAAPGHFFNVIRNGWGAMYAQGDHVRGDDRWRVAAYIKALQLSQHMPMNDLTPDERQKLEQTR